MKAMAAVVLLTMFGCASLQSKEGPWAEATVRSERMDWRWCSEDLDGPTYSGKGWCWQGEECREIKRTFGKDYQECRPKPYFCAFSDVECMLKNHFNEKRVKN